jgi:surface antigen
MPSQDNRADNRSGPVPIPGLKQEESFSGPWPAGGGLAQPLSTEPFEQDQQPTQGQFRIGVSPNTGRLPVQRSATGQFTSTNLARVLTTTLPRVGENTTSQRIPVVIKGTMKKSARGPLAPAVHRKRRMVVSLLGVLMLLLVTGLTLYTVTPLGHDVGLNWNPLAPLPGNNVLTGQNSGANQIIAQATATAVYHQQTDGYSGGAAQLAGNGAGSLSWPLGQCTYWANYRYRALSGHWVSWTGNADQWVAGARSAGWNVSSVPHVPSIIVLMPYVQLASGYGHVAVVESVVSGSSPVTVHTSNMNWYNNGGGWDIESFENFTVGSGVYFIWHK